MLAVWLTPANKIPILPGNCCIELRDNRQEVKLMTTRKNENDQQRLEMRASDMLDPNSQIGVRLRSLYSAVQDEAIPDRFLDLLEKLDQAELMASAKAAK